MTSQRLDVDKRVAIACEQRKSDRTCVCLNFQRLSVDSNGIDIFSGLNLKGDIDELVF
ncbi:hypothetical protein [Coleofasciculus sp. FACHB-SPT9]|uniref:hypothetical protein n=1 Tax=Cyanophyceae TaxID=3028117 RepID=UPI001689D46C|nr:hypothetical protein [Coleofasciculus sp. FACHB-SPT9]MBD1888848.1 hypothetical protein [Coleofasciculus sp. FACHB-SPT9]